MINDEEYTNRVLARCSNEFHGELVDFESFCNLLEQFIEIGNELDKIKKSLFYGKPYHEKIDYTVAKGSQHGNNMTHAILGVATEAVELCEQMLKGFRTPWEVDLTNLQEEFGDLNWYRTLGLSVLKQTHVENITQNDCKLEKRYGPAFTQDAALNRNLDAERDVLEGRDD